MNITIEISTTDLRRLLDATSHDSNLLRVPVESLVAQATKRGIASWERPVDPISADPDLDPVSNLVETCRILVRGWEARQLDPKTPPDFRHVLAAVRKLEEAGYRR